MSAKLANLTSIQFEWDRYIDIYIALNCSPIVYPDSYQAFARSFNFILLGRDTPDSYECLPCRDMSEDDFIIEYISAYDRAKLRYSEEPYDFMTIDSLLFYKALQHGLDKSARHYMKYGLQKLFEGEIFEKDERSLTYNFLYSAVVYENDGTGDDVNHLYQSFYNKLSLYKKISRRRLFQLLLGLEAVRLKRDTCFDNTSLLYNPKGYVKCLRMYYRVTPDPITNTVEIANLLHMMFGNYKPDFVKSLHEDFERLFPESKEDHRPRNLKHLCRCQVRENLIGESLPASLEKLSIPHTLKGYLLREE